MSVIEKLKEAVRSVVEAERQDLYAEARLNDGRVIATEAEAFSAGAPVRVMSEDGEQITGARWSGDWSAHS